MSPLNDFETLLLTIFSRAILACAMAGSSSDNLSSSSMSSHPFKNITHRSSGLS
ncbi:MAG: hypothetical protein PHP26_09580 [Syntrophomonas sp.]|nr:hypothetical protein [Syntrophomonas sp.]MDD4627184.1 hypothetical protein [Syntrophomonas sp.]